MGARHLAVAALFWLVPDTLAGAETGLASWYGPGFCGRRTASGERFDCSAMTAAHRSIRFGSLVRVTDVDTGRSVVVRISDRGPFIRGRIIDLSPAAKSALGMKGMARVRLELTGSPASAP
jgi:rare lipoprotein A